MQEVKDFITDNPQVSASMITAAFGIFGIFINIIINLWFRNQDYKNENRMRKIESLEVYYLPLYEKSKYIITCIQNITDNKNEDLYKILSNGIGASYASQIKILRDALKELYRFFHEGKYAYPDSYNLFQAHKTIKTKIFIVNEFIEKNTKLTEKEMIKEIIKELSDLTYQIQQYEMKLTIDNFIRKCIKRSELWVKYRKLNERE